MADAAPSVPVEAFFHLQRVATSILRGGASIEGALVAVVEGAEAVLGCERAALYVVDWRAHAMRLTVSTTPIEEGIKLRVDSGLVGACATHGLVINVADAYADERFDPTVDICTARKTHSVLCVPIVGDGGLVSAVLCALNKRADPGGTNTAFGPADEFLLSNIAVMAGHTLSRMRSQYKARRAEEVNAALLDITKQLAGSIDAGHVAQLVRERLAPLLHASAVNVFLLDAATTPGPSRSPPFAANRQFMVLASDPSYLPGSTSSTTPTAGG
jgi:adenylate cyclase